MGNFTKIDNLADELIAGMEEYSEETTQKVKSAVDKVSKQAVTDLKKTSPVRTGAYGKDWAKRTPYEDRRSKRNTVYNRKHYQLTHLLEYGHVGRNGHRVKAVKHIEKVEKKAIADFTKAIESEV